MRQIDLREYGTTQAARISAVELDILQRHQSQLGITVTPTVGRPDSYDLTARSIVGAVDLDDLSIRIRPKLPVGRLVALLAYATDAVDVTKSFDFAEHSELVDALADALAHEARRAFRRGLLNGYRATEEALPAVRGRIRFDAQVRRRFGLAPPVEVRYDDFTADITANRLVKAAVARLGRRRLRRRRNRADLRWTAAVLADVASVEYRPAEVPTVTFDRLNRHYRRVVALARLVLQWSAFEADRGNVRVPGFLVDMNRLFEQFVVQALREELGVSAQVLRSGSRGGTTLDEEGQIRLEPDLSWWLHGVCTFVGDVKYKSFTARAPNPDFYQLLAYATAFDLPGGLLIYAGTPRPTAHVVRHAGKRLEVVSIDLSGSLPETLALLREQVAARILRASGRHRSTYSAVLSPCATHPARDTRRRT